MDFQTRVRGAFNALFDTKALTPINWPSDLLAVPTLSGPPVTPQSAITVPTVAAAVQLISGAIGTLPFAIYEAADGGGKDMAVNYPGFDIVRHDANDWTSSDDFRKQLAQDALLYGNGYALANRVNGRIIELIRLIPGSVSVWIDANTGEPSYHVTTAPGQSLIDGQVVAMPTSSQGERVYSFRDVVHIRSPLSVDGWAGVSPITLCREAIGLALTLEQHAARLFGNGARPSGVLSFDNKLDPATSARIRNSWHSQHAGGASGHTAVLEHGGKFIPLTFNSVDAQFAEMRQFQIVEIARAFRIPPVLLADYSRATWSNSEEMGRQFLQYCLLSWLRAFEAAYKRVFIDVTQRQTFSIEFNVDDLLRGDTAQRGEYIAKMRAAGVITANEARAGENLPAMPSGDSLDNPFTTSGNPNP